MTQDQSRSIKYIGIDPGKSGGIAVISGDCIEVKKCPETVHDMALLFALTMQETPPSCTLVMIEKVWARPHDGRASVFTFAGNYGQWQGIEKTSKKELLKITCKRNVSESKQEDDISNSGCNAYRRLRKEYL